MFDIANLFLIKPNFLNQTQRISFSYFTYVFTSVSINFSAVENPIVKKGGQFFRYVKSSSRADKSINCTRN